MKKMLTAKELGSSFAVSNVYIGAMVGPALVAGTYAVIYFLPNGCDSIWLPFIACGIVGIMCALASNIIRYFKKYEYGSLSKEIYFNKKILYVLFEIYVLASNIVGAAIVQNMSGTFMHEIFGMDPIWGMIIIGAISLFLIKYRDSLIRIVNSVMSVVMLVGFVIITILVVILCGDKMGEVLSAWTVPEGVSIADGIFRSCQFAFASSAFAITLCCVEQPIKKAGQSAWIGIFTTVVGGAMMALSCISFLPFMGEIVGDDVPLIYVMNNYIAPSYPWIPVVYYIVMILAIISSLVPGAYMVSSRMETIMPTNKFLKTQNIKNMTAATVYMIIATVISLAGLTNVVTIGLNGISYVGMPLVVIPICFIWPFILHNRKKKGIKYAGDGTSVMDADFEEKNNLIYKKHL